MRGYVIRGFGSLVFVGVAAVLAAGAMAPRTAGAAPNPFKQSLKCRKVLGKSATKLALAGLKAIDKCHQSRNKGRTSADCNVLEGNEGFARQRAAFIQKVDVACKPGDPVRENYPNGDVAASVAPSIQTAVEASGSTVQGLPSFAGEPAQVKSLSKCHGAIGKGRTKTVLLALKAITKCQKARDKGAQTFPPADEGCLAAGDGAAAKGTKQVGKKCGGLELPVVTQGGTTGGIITACADPTSCVSEESLATARRIGSAAYGGGCGNGFQEGGEQCDDGNGDNDDGCSNQCTLPQCGDGVRQGDEQCDDGNFIANDGCNAQCEVPACGDGEVEGDEQCDDGNDVDDDGCTACVLDPTACTAEGTITVRTSLEFPQDLGVSVGAVAVELSYPAILELPSFAFPGEDAFTFPCSPADAGACPDVRFFPSTDAFFGNAFDLDTTGDGVEDLLRANFAKAFPGEVDQGPLYEAVFDCAPGTEIDPASLPCAIVNPVDPGGTAIDPAGFRCNVEVTTATPGS